MLVSKWSLRLLTPDDTWLSSSSPWACRLLFDTLQDLQNVVLAW